MVNLICLLKWRILWDIFRLNKGIRQIDLIRLSLDIVLNYLWLDCLDNLIIIHAWLHPCSFTLSYLRFLSPKWRLLARSKWRSDISWRNLGYGRDILNFKLTQGYCLNYFWLFLLRCFEETGNIICKFFKFSNLLSNFDSFCNFNPRGISVIVFTHFCNYLNL